MSKFLTSASPFLALSNKFDDTAFGANINIEFFYFVAGPGSPPQELEAGFDAGIICKTIEFDVFSKAIPAQVIHEIGENLF